MVLRNKPDIQAKTSDKKRRFGVIMTPSGTLSSDDDDAGENVRKTIVLICKTLAVHVRYNLWYNSLPSSAKQRREMTTIKV